MSDERIDITSPLFSTKPTLKFAKIMKVGDTFRLNVACTRPYNADFDGDRSCLKQATV